MKAPTVATLHPRHGDFAAKNGAEPTCSVNLTWIVAPSTVEGAHQDRATARTRV